MRLMLECVWKFSWLAQFNQKGVIVTLLLEDAAVLTFLFAGGNVTAPFDG
jgi:hypothetical protein